MKTQADKTLMIAMNHVGLRYNGGPEVLSDISFALKGGDFYYLNGASGAGKTSLIRLLSLSILPTRGDLMIFGQNISDVSKRDRANMRTKIGVIFQDFRLIPHLTIYENITLPLKLMNIFEEKQKQSVMDVLDWIGLKNHAHMKPAFLSGGQQQRAAIARAVITKPKILLADEPTGSLDTNIGLRIISLFQELNRNGTAILLATHNKSLIEMHPYPVLTLEKGGLSI